MKTKVPYKWPFALDLLKRQYDANSDKRLMKFQSQYFDKLVANFEINLFGNSGYISTDPRTVETLLATNFEGKETRSVERRIWRSKKRGRLRLGHTQ